MITNYTPSRNPVSEYAYYLAKAVAEDTRVSDLHVLADRLTGQPKNTRIGNITLIRCWDYDSLSIPVEITRAISTISIDYAWFNITLGSFGSSIANLTGLMTPLTLKRYGIRSIVTLHNLVDLIGNVKYQGGALTLWGARLATKILCCTSLVCVLLPEYEEILRTRYHAKNVVCMPHGTLGEVPPITQVNGKLPSKTLLSFGIYGTHKRLDTTLEAMKLVWELDPSICLWIAGGSNSHNPDYLSILQAKYGNLPNVRFVGYVEEAKVPDLFAQVDAVILTNQSVGGESGSLVQAGMYGKPVICTDLSLFRRKNQEGYVLDFFDVNNPLSIADAISSLFASDPLRLAEIGTQNREAATKHPMHKVAGMYVEQLIRGL